MPIDYKKELETASKGMIMIHDPKLLIKLIVRMLVGKVHIKHAAMILYEQDRDAYVLNISKGETGIKIPAGFARFDKSHPLIQLFTSKDYKYIASNKNAILAHDLNKLIWKEMVIKNGNGMTEILHSVGNQMQMFNAVACVPAFYQDNLLAILLLGEKVSGGKFDQEELDFFAALASDAAMAIRNAQLFEGLKSEAKKNHDLFLRTMMVLGSAIEAKDSYTHGHTQRVTAYALAVARRMIENGTGDFDAKFLEDLYVGGMLHDIGKIGIPESILNKTGKLTDEEFEIMKCHPVYGVEILEPLSELKESLKGVKYHHERYDGRGYPEGLAGEDIPMIALIISVGDAFDAMVTDRPYRKGISHEQAIQEIKKNVGIQFHALPARAMVELYEAGRLKSDGLDERFDAILG